MGLKKIEKGYTEFLKTLEDVGVTLNESQKKSFDTFMCDIKTLVTETKQKTMKVTSKVLGEEYKKLFESIISLFNEKAKKEEKINTKIAEIKQRHVLSEAIDTFLDKEISKVLPKKAIVDYNKMAKNERIIESMKTMLGIDLSNVDAKIVNEKDQKIAELEQKLNESVETNKKTNAKRINEYINSKLSKMTLTESNAMKKLMNGKKLIDIEKDFEKLYESVKEEQKKDEPIENTDPQEEIKQDQEEKNLEEAVNDILHEREENEKKASEENGEKEETNPENSEDSSETTEKDTDEDNNEDGDEPVSESQVGIVITPEMMARFIESQEEGLFS